MGDLAEKCDTLQGFRLEQEEKISQLRQEVEQLKSIQSRVDCCTRSLREISSFGKKLEKLLNEEGSN